MSNEHPITPPPELVLQLIELPLSEEERLAAAYRAGADQELEAFGGTQMKDVGETGTVTTFPHSPGCQCPIIRRKH